MGSLLAKIMRGGIPLGSLFGSKLYLNPSWFVMYAFIVILGYFRGGTVFMPLIIFPCLGVIILMHEYGHAFAARLFGIGTTDITIGALGGAAVMERMPEKGWQEVIVALAGPAVNIALALISFFYLDAVVVFDQDMSFETVLAEHPVASLSFLINLMIAGFNLIPAFPMDGGRVLRGVLSHLMSYRMATKIAAYVGLLCASGFGYVWVTSGVGGFAMPLIAYFLVTTNLSLLKFGGEDRPEEMRAMVLARFAELEADLKAKITACMSNDPVDTEKLGSLYEMLYDLTEEQTAFLERFDRDE